MRNKITTEDLIKKRFSDSEAAEIFDEIKQEVEDIKWGGKRSNAGRKPANGIILSFQMRVSEKEREFLKFARMHNLNYDKLMEC